VLTQFALAILAAIGLVYLIMVATFRSLIKPLVAVGLHPLRRRAAPRSRLVVTGTALSLPAMNRIADVDRHRGPTPSCSSSVEQYASAVCRCSKRWIEGGRTAPPILMTAVATIARPGAPGLQRQQRVEASSELRSPSSSSAASFTSTLLTLILVPVLYSEASRFTSARTNR